MRQSIVFLITVMALLLATAMRGDEDGRCGKEDAVVGRDRARAMELKIVAFFSILVCGVIGFGLPVLGWHVPVLHPDGDVFFLIKAFATGVIVAMSFGALVGAIGTLVVDTLFTGYFMWAHFKKKDVAALVAVKDEEKQATAEWTHHPGGAAARRRWRPATPRLRRQPGQPRPS
ncbi:hypothetical protein ABZP36_002199 [Zizania latifolia]